ncbi:MAG: DUF4276 family protein [Cytophagales bacterium]|nr:DUF4276 family protein [Bernardetiaceae bacterium]MDW8205986.1 DUF4276 family protein [Cytophagales bacterium]
MAWEIIVGLLAEGTTDQRFLKPVVEKTFNQIALTECIGEIEIRVLTLNKTAGLSFVQQAIQAAKDAYKQYGINMLCIHADADNSNSEAIYQSKINPTLAQVAEQSESECCKIVIPIVPIQETEAWMLADTHLLKEEINTTKSDNELGIHRPPEMIANPKGVIEDAIRKARQHLPKRRRYELSINDLYLPIGEKVAIHQLEKLNSFQHFQNNVRSALVKLGVRFHTHL